MFQRIGILAIKFMQWITQVWRNIVGVVVGIMVGGQVNMALINISTDIIPAPAGADIKTMKGLQASIHLFEPKHFLMPFLAHALGTLVAALLATLIAKSHRKRMAMVPGFVFFLGGAMAVSMIPAPLWFNITDLALAYIPMAFLGYWISTKIVTEAA
jgi:hypothetical protein